MKLLPVSVLLMDHPDCHRIGLGEGRIHVHGPRIYPA
jgi:hypothetical protein